MKKILVLFLSLTAILVLSACDDKDAKELVIISDFGREVSEKEIFQKDIFEKFEKDNNVKIKFETFADNDETFKKIESEQKSKNYTVDLVLSHFGKMSDYLDAGYITDSTELENDMDDRTFLSTFDGTTKKDGKRYFFPINSDVYLNIGNKKAFDYLPAGVTEEKILSGDYTWADYIAWGKAISDAGQGQKIHLNGLDDKMFLYQVGGMALSNNGEFPKMNDAGNKKAWEDVLAMKDYVNPVSHTTNEPTASLADETVWLSYALMAPVSQAYTTQPAKYHVFPAPKGTSGKAGTIIGGHGIGIVENAPNEDLAKKFVEHFTAKEQAISAALGTIPAIEEASTQLGNDPEDVIISKGLTTVSNANTEGLQMIPEYTIWGGANGVKSVYDTVYNNIFGNSANISTNEDLHSALDTAQTTLEGLKK